MSRPTIPLLTAADPLGGQILRAPKVGLFSDRPENGAVVQPGSTAGTLTQLHRRFSLLVPDEVKGRVVLEGGSLRSVPVEYGQALFRVVPVTVDEARVDALQVEALPGRSATLAVVAPTDGVFYRAPAVGAKPFVTPGDRVATGRPVGLIEVMKTFNPIVYAGAGLPDEALVVEVVAEDGQEVRAGQALIVVKRC